MSENQQYKCTLCNNNYQEWSKDPLTKEKITENMCQHCYEQTIVFALKEDNEKDGEQSKETLDGEVKFLCGTCESLRYKPKN